MRGKPAPALFLVICATETGIWLGTRGSGTIAYLGRPLYENLLSALPAHGTSSVTHGAPVPAPLADRAAAYTAVLLTLVLLAAGWRQIIGSRFRHRGRATHPALLAFGVAALSYPLVLCVRLFAGDSSELAGRALTFVFLPIAAVVAPTLAHLRLPSPALSKATPILAVAVLAVGGVVSGWPPWWERLPGTFRVASFERGVDPQNIDAAFWVRSHLTPDNGFAGDFISGSLVNTLGDQVAILDDAPLFYAEHFGTTQRNEIRAEGIDYLIVDERMADGLPAAGGYFAITPASIPLRKPMPKSSLAKFDRAEAVDRIYDSGAIAIYRVGVAK